MNRNEKDIKQEDIKKEDIKEEDIKEKDIKEIKKRKKCKHPECKKMILVEINNMNEITIFCEKHLKMVQTYEKPNECLICVEEFDKTNCMPLFPCCHWVCKNCVILSGKKECPVCRQPVILNKLEQNRCLKVHEKMIREKEQQQLNEDRRFAENLQREIMREMREINRIPVLQYNIEVNENNVNDILQIMNVLDGHERYIYEQAVRNYNPRLLNNRGNDVGIIIHIEVDTETESEEEDEE
jgi:hypothetical protein